MHAFKLKICACSRHVAVGFAIPCSRIYLQEQATAAMETPEGKFWPLAFSPSDAGWRLSSVKITLR